MMLLGRFFIRLLIVYLFIFIFPFPLDQIPFGIGNVISGWVGSFWEWFIPLFSKNIIGYTDEISFVSRGSGDTTYDYLLLAGRLSISIVVVLFWSTIDKVGKESRSFGTLMILLRYYLAFAMFTYGFSKVFYLQFPELNLMSLTVTYGNSSPMGLLWKFMGYSETYSLFTGLIEVLGGFLLLFRYTKIFGAIIILGVMVNVFLLNMSFDVPVKLFSFHLCLISIVVLMPDFRNIVRFLILNKPTDPPIINTYFLSKKKNLMSYAAKGILLFYVLFNVIESKLQSQGLYGKRVPKHELYGIYDIQIFVVNNDTLPPMLTDTIRWKKLIIDKRNSLVIKMDDRRIGMRHEIDSFASSIKLTPYLNSNKQYNLEFKKMDSLLYLNMIDGKDTITITSLKHEKEDFFLVQRGFNWINEYPMNR